MVHTTTPHLLGFTPTPPTTPPPRGDPFNCAIGAEDSWGEAKNVWCCRVHHKGCPHTYPPVTLPHTYPPTMPPLPPTYPPVFPTALPRPADPYNCAEGYANWLVGWSV